MYTLKKPRPKYNGQQKIPLKLDITMLNMMIGIIFKKNSLLITRKHLVNMKKLVDIIDDTIYQTDEGINSRFQFIKRALDARMDKGFENDEAIINYCKSDIVSKEMTEIVKNLDYYVRLKVEEIKYILKAIEDRLQYAYLMYYKDDMYDIVDRLENGSYSTFKEMNEAAKHTITNMITSMRRVKTADTVNRLSMHDENAEIHVEDSVTRMKDPSKLLTTGIQKLNQILAPGFYSKKLYTILGLPAQSGLIY